MEVAIRIRDLSFNYKDKTIFKKLNLKIERNKITTILGENGSGKTTLLKLLIGEIKHNSIIIINGIFLDKQSIDYIYKKTGIVFQDIKKTFIQDYVLDELVIPLENMQYSKSEIKRKVSEISKLFQIENILNRNIKTLNDKEKTILAFAVALIGEPNILIIDDSMVSLDEKTKKEIFEILKTQDNLTTIYLTSNSNDSLYGDNIVILADHKAIKSGPIEEVYQDEEAFKKANLELPFIIDLSKKLQFYNLIDKDYLDAKEMVNSLWK